MILWDFFLKSKMRDKFGTEPFLLLDSTLVKPKYLIKIKKLKKLVKSKIFIHFLLFFRWSIWSCSQLIQDMLNIPIYSLRPLQDTNLWNSTLMIHYVLYVNLGQIHLCRFTMAGKLASAVEHFSGMHNSGGGSEIWKWILILQAHGVGSGNEH